ncbi:MAG: terminase small subunit [Candidatus Arsenophonus phytopathogenicus]
MVSKKKIGYKTVGDVVPSVAGLACYLGISRSTAQEYAKENKEFSGEFNPTIVKLMLSNHGYAEKQETALTGKDGGAIETDNKISIEFIGMTISEGAN